MNNVNNLSRCVFRDPRYFLAFGFGSGLSPVAPGTCGTITAILIYFFMAGLTWELYLGFIVVAFVVGIVISDEITKELKINDYKGIVWDEFIGYWLTMFLVPCGFVWIFLGFILFRWFDIWKPFPIKHLERCNHSGFAIMIDDVMAALYAWIVLQLIIFVWRQ